MAKARSVYVCSECGASALQWFGICPSCGAGNTLMETAAEGKSSHRYSAVAGKPAQAAAPVRLDRIETREVERLPTGLAELVRVLGGGLVSGQVVLIGGDPGIGKSTLFLQALAAIAPRHKTLYVSGEESAEQVALRAARLGLDAGGVELLAEIQLERIAAALDAARAQVAVID